MFTTSVLIDVLDVAVLATLIYQVLVILQRTRATQLILGVVYFVVIFAIAYVLRMAATIWLFERLIIIVPFALLIIFQPELRSFFERAGRRGLLFRPAGLPEREDLEQLLETIVQGLEEMSSEHIGALIVLEREIGLNQYIGTGERIDARVRKDLLKAIFYKGNPLHDGAVIVRGDRIISARSFLPLSDSRDIPSHLGTRHRAALGITEVSDAVSLVASEETGHLSLFQAGKPAFRLTPVTLRHMVKSILLPETEREQRLFQWRGPLARRASTGVKKAAAVKESAEDEPPEESSDADAVPETEESTQAGQDTEEDEGRSESA